MQREQAKLLGLYLRGFLQVFLYIFLTSLLAMWALQALALAFGEAFDWGAVLMHLFLSLSFLAFFPGQKLWTYRMVDDCGRTHTIVGDEGAPHAD